MIRTKWHKEPKRKMKERLGKKIQYHCPKCGVIGGGIYQRIPRICRKCGGVLDIWERP